MNTPLKWMALAGLVWLMAGGATAEDFVERPANSAQEAHRFLFVVETSAANRKAEGNYRQALFDLIVGGVNGNMYSGDSYGIWTYNEEVYSGEFPVTIWEKGQSLDLASQAAAFLQKQKYTKKASLSFLVDSLRRLSDRVNEVNIFIISSGEDFISGTPFDQNINAAYKALAKQSAKTGRPMVTSFAVRKGRPVRSGVVLAGDRIILPDRPPEQIALPPKRSPGVTNSAPVAALPTATTATTNSQIVPAPPRKKVMQIVTKTNSVAAPLPATPVSLTHSAPIAVSVVPAAATGSTEQVNVVARETPGAFSNATTQPNPSPNAASGPSPGPIVPAPLAAAVPAPIPTATTTPPSQMPTGGPPAKSMVWEELPSGSALTATVTLPTTNTTTAGALVLMAREALAGSNSNAAGSDGSPIQGTMVLVRTIDGLSAGVLLAIGGILFGAATLLLVLLLRRASPAPVRGSLITQAMQPERKT